MSDPSQNRCLGIGRAMVAVQAVAVGDACGVSIMLRIIRIDSDGGGSVSTLRLEGKLIGPWVGELRRAYEELQVPAGSLALNLSAVTFIDRAGVQLLGDLMHRGATIYGCRGFIAELLSLGQS